MQAVSNPTGLPQGDRIIELLTRQATIYEQLRELCMRQRGLIQTDHAENLLEILRDRQILMNELRHIQTELSPLRGRWETACNGLSPADHELVGALLERSRIDVKAILESDNEDTA